MEFTKEIIDELFKNEYFQEKLNEYVVENFKIQQNYNAWEGENDPKEYSFAGQPIEIKSKVYGY